MALGPNDDHSGMDDATKLRGSAHWRPAVWGLRLAGLGLAVIAGGLATRLWSTGAGLSILAVGMGIYLVGGVVVFIGFILVRRALPGPRPSYWRFRRTLMHDVLHALS